MSGLLQRVAGQALGTNSAGSLGDATRIRPAVTFHGQVPVGLAVHSEQVAPTVRAAWPVAADESHAERPNQSNDQRLTTDAVPKEPRDSATSTQARANAYLTPPLQTPLTARRFPEPAELPRPARLSTPEIRTPQPLLGEVTSEPALSRSIMPASPPRIVIDSAQTRTPAEPTEVHVHIGRIEVTAVPETTPRKKSRSAPKRDTLPLSDYLARRRST